MRQTPTHRTYGAVRITYDSAVDFGETRHRFEQQVPLLDPAATIGLVLENASWDKVRTTVEQAGGPTGLTALARLDSGSLFSLSGTPSNATLYLVGNPTVAREIAAAEPVGALYAPFRVAVYTDGGGAHIAYDQPSSVFKSLGSPEADAIAADLDDKIKCAVEEACR